MADRELNGIPLHEGSLKILQALSRETGVPFPA
jgi:hypothetical protein